MLAFVVSSCAIGFAAPRAAVQHRSAAGTAGPCSQHRTLNSKMLSIDEVGIGDKVRVTGSDEYPVFFHVPGHKKGFVANGMIGTVTRLYKPGECDHLDRSDERDIFVTFDEPKKWAAHFLPDELAAPTSEASWAPLGLVEIELCDLAEGDDCDRVENFMTKAQDAALLSPDMPMLQAAELLSSQGITGAPVVSDGRLVGVLTQFDFLYQEARSAKDFGKVKLDSGKWEDSVRKSLAGTVAGAMSKPVAVAPAADMVQVAALMLNKRFNHVPVVDGDNKVVGILTSQARRLRDGYAAVTWRLRDGQTSQAKGATKVTWSLASFLLLTVTAVLPPLAARTCCAMCSRVSKHHDDSS